MSKSIQLISYNADKLLFPHMVLTRFDSPKSLDEHDVNIIDLSDNRLWVTRGSQPTTIDYYNHLKSIKEMVQNHRTSSIIYVLPKNCIHNYFYQVSSKSYSHHTYMKDNLSSLSTILSAVISPSFPNDILSYENTRTLIDGYEFEADFHFVHPSPIYSVITQSNKSLKNTTLRYSDTIYLTTLQITSSEEQLFTFVNFILPDENKSAKPEWFDSVIFSDDEMQQSIIRSKQQEIDTANAVISAAQKKLAENDKYKSILYSNGSELVSVIFQILEQLLDCDLSVFEDKKDEDFIIKTEAITFIGEIKGINSNVRNSNISQIDNHYHSYIEKMEDAGIQEQVKQLLIITPFRTQPPDTREPIHEKQISLAKRNGCLIIDTYTLLKIFERFQQGSISTEKCLEIFSNTSGLLKLSDFD